jgi:hypothetical protein
MNSTRDNVFKRRGCPETADPLCSTLLVTSWPGAPPRQRPGETDRAPRPRTRGPAPPAPAPPRWSRSAELPPLTSGHPPSRPAPTGTGTGNSDGHKMQTRLTAGEKPNRKRMATLVTVYDAEPARRRPHDVVAPPGGRRGARALRPGPKALTKWLAGSVRHDPAEVIAAAFDEAGARDPGHLRTWVVLVDGAEHRLDLIRAEAARRAVTIHVVIDIIHVLEYLWKAAWSLHAADDPAAEGRGRGQGARGAGRRQRPGRRRDHRRGRRRRRPDGKPASRRGHVRAIPEQQARAPPLRSGPPSGLADRDRHHRGSMPAPHRRPPRHRRGQMGPGRR